MHYVHPLAMLCLTGLVLAVLRLGAVRFVAKRLGKKGLFAWRRHVLLGKLALAGLFAGSAGGLAVTWGVWSGPASTGAHAWLAACILALAASGLATGLRLDREKAKAPPRTALLHAVGNTLLALLALVQIYTGYRVLADFVW